MEDRQDKTSDTNPSRDVNARMEELIGRIDGLIGPRNASHVPELQFKVPRPALGARCPQCNKRALRKARRESILDFLAAFILFTPYRCRYCRYFEMRFMLEAIAMKGVFGSKPRSSR